MDLTNQGIGKKKPLITKHGPTCQHYNDDAFIAQGVWRFATEAAGVPTVQQKVKWR